MQTGIQAYRPWPYRVIKRLLAAHPELLTQALQEHAEPLALADLALLDCTDYFPGSGLFRDRPLTSTCDVVLVHGFAKRTVLGVLLNRQKGRGVQSEDPGTVVRRRILVALRHCSLAGQSKSAGRQPSHICLVSDAHSKGLGTVEHIVAETCGELGKLLLDLVEARLLLALERHAGQLCIADFVLHDTLLRRTESRKLRPLLDRLERLVHGLALAGLQIEGNDELRRIQQASTQNNLGMRQLREPFREGSFDSLGAARMQPWAPIAEAPGDPGSTNQKRTGANLHK